MNNKTTASPNQSCPTTTRSVCGKVLEQLEQDQVQPHSRMYFHSRECFVWSAWFISIIIGAAAVAVTLYISFSVPYTIYEATHDNLLTAFVSALPYIWLVIFALTAYLAIVNLRNTRRGYRYRTATLLGSSIFISLLIGVTLQAIGHGYQLDRTLGQWIDAYPSYEKQRYAAWQNPDEGRLIGTLLPYENGTSSDATSTVEFVFADSEQAVWQIDTSELRQSDIDLLFSAGEQEVRLMGTSTSPGIFKICGVFPWLPGKTMSRDQMYQTREAFIETVRTHYEAVAQVGDSVTVVAPDVETVMEGERPAGDPARRDCAHIAAIQRAERLLAQ